MPVYVLGSPALFGRTEGFMDYKDPKTGQVYRHLPVRQGPGERRAGDDPAAVLVRRAAVRPDWTPASAPGHCPGWPAQTGGIYFVTRIGTARITFDPAGMREYRPDWVEPRAVHGPRPERTPCDGR